MNHRTQQRNRRVAVLALDLERTLIDHALSAQARPGLYDFLTFCDARFPRITIFTTVAEEDAREVLNELNDAGYLPEGLLERLEFVAWSGEFKDLTFVPNATPEEVLLVDDDGGWVRPEQQEQWLSIAAWDGGTDSELQRIQAELERVAVRGRNQ